MPKYTQTIGFTREFSIEAKNAEEANNKLQDWINQVEFDSDTMCDGNYYNFEDDPIECPKCNGRGAVGEEDNAPDCDKCNGSGSIPF